MDSTTHSSEHALPPRIFSTLRACSSAFPPRARVAGLLYPLRVAPDHREVLVPVLSGDQDDILDTDASDALVRLGHLLVDVLRVAHGAMRCGEK